MRYVKFNEQHVTCNMLQHADCNTLFQLFEERKVLIGHWFENWTDAQRRQFLEHLVEKFNKVSEQNFEKIFIATVRLLVTAKP